MEMSEADLDEKDYLIRAMQKDLNKILAEESGDADSQPARTMSVINTVLAESVKTQRLYFVVRSVLMSLISALTYFIVVLFLGVVNAVQAAFLGILVFVAALVVSRLFDKHIVRASKKIISFLNRHRRLRRLVLKNL